MSDQDLSYCAREVRRLDNDRFLTALFAPADRREDLFALYAFNIEIAKTREVVSEPMLGRIRLQWWRETIEQIGRGEVRNHEVIRPLADAIRRHDLDTALFERLIDGREADLDDEAPADLTCLENYADVTSTPVVRLALQLLGVRDGAAHEAARHVGIAWALVGQIRALPHLLRAHRHRLPRSLLAQHGVNEQKLFDGKLEAGLPAVVRDVAEAASTHLRQARAFRAKVPKAATPALLQATLADLYLGTLAKAGHDPADPRVQMRHPFRQLRMGWAGTTGRW